MSDDGIIPTAGREAEDDAAVAPATAAADAGRYRAPALDRGLDILEVLAAQSGGLTQAEIVKELGLGPSQIHRMLQRLVARGYVARAGGGDRYALTMKLFLLGAGHPPVRRLIAQAQPMMDAFAREWRQSCHLVVPERGIGLVVAHASPIDTWEFRARIGAQLDLFATGSGLTLLAFQHPSRLSETLGQWGMADGDPRRHSLEPTLKRVREAGYRVEPSAQAVGVTDLSAPILGPAGDAIAVLTCAYIEHPGDTRAGLRDATLDSLLELTSALSASGPASARRVSR